MRIRVAFAVGIGVWILILGILLQPHTSSLPLISHAVRLDKTAPDLPTLSPARYGKP